MMETTKLGTSEANYQLVNDGDSLTVLGQILPNGQPSVTTEANLNSIRVGPTGKITSGTTAVQVNGTNTQIFNEGTIEGAMNGIFLADGDRASATIVNKGTLTSGSRAVNIGGMLGTLVNSGRITISANPRNGTVYTDQTAQQFDISNQLGGVIEVGAGLNGDAISLELGANVTGSVVNYGTVQGRGTPTDLVKNQASALRLFHGDQVLGSTLNGNIVNYGTLASEHSAGIIIQANTRLNGQILNYGTINSGDSPHAIDTTAALGEIKIRNEGTIKGDILLGAGNDSFVNELGKTGVRVDGGDGNDVLVGGNFDDVLIGGNGNDTLTGGMGNDILSGSMGNDILSGGKGSDRFTLVKGHGSDQILDFKHGRDHFLTGLRFQDLHLNQIGNNTQIKSGTEVLATVMGVKANTITAADFVAR
jgi:RTX calcium-binding nonapeptide repeat (4 copies)